MVLQAFLHGLECFIFFCSPPTPECFGLQSGIGGVTIDGSRVEPGRLARGSRKEFLTYSRVLVLRAFVETYWLLGYKAQFIFSTQSRSWLGAFGFSHSVEVSFESWIGSYFELYDAFHDSYPLLSPLDLGSLGYSGEESIYLTKQVMDIAYENSGTALDFYKSYNASHYDVQKSFGVENAKGCESALALSGFASHDLSNF